MQVEINGEPREMSLAFVYPSGVPGYIYDQFCKSGASAKLSKNHLLLDASRLWSNKAEDLMYHVNNMIKLGIVKDPDLFGERNGYTVVLEDNDKRKIIAASNGAELRFVLS